jgi:hypothetical protein
LGFFEFTQRGFWFGGRCWRWGGYGVCAGQDGKIGNQGWGSGRFAIRSCYFTVNGLGGLASIDGLDLDLGVCRQFELGLGQID